MAIATGISMCARLHRPPVIAGGDNQRVYAVHDALVVGGGAVRVNHREVVSVENAFDHLLTLECWRGEELGGDADLRTGQTQVSQIGKDAQAHLGPGDFFDQRRDRLGHGVDRVGAHGITHIDDQMRDQHRPTRALRKGVDFNVPAAATQRVEELVFAVRQLDDFVLAPQQAQARIERVSDINDLHLRAHQRQRTGGLKPACLPRQLGHKGGRRYHRRFLDHHGHDHVAAIDLEVACDGIGQLEGADHVLDHAVSPLQRQGTRLTQQRDVISGQVEQRLQMLQTLGGRQATELGKARINTHGSILWSLLLSLSATLKRPVPA